METDSIHKPALYIISTPIGNLKDITLRALETLRSCDVVFAEDTRISRILFQNYGIKTPLRYFPVRNIEKALDTVRNLLLENQAVGFITDSGTPGISDPGATLVRFVRTRFPEIPVIPVPGPSALSTIMSVSGWKTNPALYLGFLSSKATKRKKTLWKYRKFKGCIILFESVHRITSLLEDVKEIFPGREILIGREMTKKFEDFLFFTSPEIDISLIPAKGEFTVMIGPLKKKI